MEYMIEYPSRIWQKGKSELTTETSSVGFRSPSLVGIAGYVTETDQWFSAGQVKLKCCILFFVQSIR